MRYIPNTETQKKKILEEIGVDNIKDLFKDIPLSIQLKDELNLSLGKSEPQLLKYFQNLSSKNKSGNKFVSFCGGGCYDHFIPSAVDYITNRAEFYTAYTPYQPEVSQGTLQAIYEYQTYINILTGMEITNASLYDGASALAEAVLMAHRIKSKSKVIVSDALHPHYKETLVSYTENLDFDIQTVGLVKGITNEKELSEKIDKDTLAVVIQMPNFLGCIEKVEKISKIVSQKDILFIVCVDPISLGIMAPPSQYGADIVVGDGQPLGNPQSFGGPTFGFLAAKKKWLRNLPGRVVGKTEDIEGKNSYTLTLQTREQHIRRKKATSNICSNQSLNALRAAVYLSLLGETGFRKVSNLCFSNSHYLYSEIGKLDNIDTPFGDSFFKEFVIKVDIDIKELNDYLLEKGIIGGIELEQYYPDLKNHMLIAVTEKKTKKEMDNFVDILKGLK